MMLPWRTCMWARSCWFGMDSVPRRGSAAGQALVGSSVDDLDLEEVGRAAVADLDPPDDIHASGRYRKDVGGTLVARALAAAIEEARRG